MRTLPAALLVSLACSDPAPNIPPSVLLLMECIECNGAELDSVVSGGQAMVPVLGDLLADGPPAVAVEQMERALHLQLSDSARAPKPPLDPDRRTAIIASQLSDYRNVYRVRAALALGAVGGPDARGALCTSPPGGFLPPVRAAVDSALARTGGPC